MDRHSSLDRTPPTWPLSLWGLSRISQTHPCKETSPKMSTAWRWISNFSTATVWLSVHLPALLGFNSEHGWSQASDHLRKGQKAFLRKEREKACKVSRRRTPQKKKNCFVALCTEHSKQVRIFKPPPSSPGTASPFPSEKISIVWKPRTLHV